MYTCKTQHRSKLKTEVFCDA